jgi:hypothetical protein
VHVHLFVLRVILIIVEIVFIRARAFPIGHGEPGEKAHAEPYREQHEHDEIGQHGSFLALKYRHNSRKLSVISSVEKISNTIMTSGAMSTMLQMLGLILILSII